MPRTAPILILLTILVTGTALGETTLTPLLDLRVRQEIQDGVYYFAPVEHDRNWIRVRTRAGLRLDASEHRFELRLTNGHRHFITPADQDFDWDELIIDRALWRWQSESGTELTVGRQDIIWPGGFLMLEGNPHDGSRTIYTNAARLETTIGDRRLDLALLHNWKYDPIVLTGDADRPLADADDSGLAARWAGDRWTYSFLVDIQDDPDEVLPDLVTYTFSSRHDGTIGDRGQWHVDLAAQYQDGRVASAYTDIDSGDTGWATAGEGQATVPLTGNWLLDAGGFYYSGQKSSLRPFRTPWGRWPKWSELYIYALIGESTPGRVTVAAWENIAAPRLMFRRPVGEHLSLRLGAQYLLAPATSWEARGLMTQAELKAELPHGFTGHLLWEMLDPGSYHDGRHGLQPMTDTVHFLRWQVMWSL